MLQYNIFLFNLPNPSTRTLTLRLTQNLTKKKEYQKTILVARARPAHKVDNLTAVCEPIIWAMWELQHLTTL
jgi:hypothetical protein